MTKDLDYRLIRTLQYYFEKYFPTYPKKPKGGNWNKWGFDNVPNFSLRRSKKINPGNWIKDHEFLDVFSNKIPAIEVKDFGDVGRFIYSAKQELVHFYAVYNDDVFYIISGGQKVKYIFKFGEIKGDLLHKSFIKIKCQNEALDQLNFFEL